MQGALALILPITLEARTPPLPLQFLFGATRLTIAKPSAELTTQRGNLTVFLVPGGSVVKTLAVLSWLRDLGIILLFLAGNQIRHGSFTVGLVIQLCAVVMFVERFVWHWHLCDLQEARSRADRTPR